MKRLRIVGCGTPDAGDDELGLMAARSLQSRVTAEIEVCSDPAGGVNVLNWCEDTEALTIIDAAEATPAFPEGHHLRLAYPSDEDKLQSMVISGSHLVGVVDALRLARTLGVLPPKVILYAIAGTRFGKGEEPTASGLAGLANALSDILGEIPVEHLQAGAD